MHIYLTDQDLDDLIKRITDRSSSRGGESTIGIRKGLDLGDQIQISQILRDAKVGGVSVLDGIRELVADRTAMSAALDVAKSRIAGLEAQVEEVQKQRDAAWKERKRAGEEGYAWRRKLEEVVKFAIKALTYHATFYERNHLYSERVEAGDQVKHIQNFVAGQVDLDVERPVVDGGATGRSPGVGATDDRALRAEGHILACHGEIDAILGVAHGVSLLDRIREVRALLAGQPVSDARDKHDCGATPVNDHPDSLPWRDLVDEREADILARDAEIAELKGQLRASQAWHEQIAMILGGDAGETVTTASRAAAEIVKLREQVENQKIAIVANAAQIEAKDAELKRTIASLDLPDGEIAKRYACTESELTAAQAMISRMLAAAVPHPVEDPTMWSVWQDARAFLTGPPAPDPRQCGRCGAVVSIGENECARCRIAARDAEIERLREQVKSLESERDDGWELARVEYQERVDLATRQRDLATRERDDALSAIRRAFVAGQPVTDPRDAEIERLKGQVARLTEELDTYRRGYTPTEYYDRLKSQRDALRAHAVKLDGLCKRAAALVEDWIYGNDLNVPDKSPRQLRADLRARGEVPR